MKHLAAIVAFSLLTACATDSTDTASRSIATTTRVLFDAGHKQVAGNADWIVDADAPRPSPAAPRNADAWSGGISAWGYELYAAGYAITQLAPNHRLTYGDGGDGDLANVDVFISVEPELTFSAAEEAAITSFTRNGGGLLLVSDHAGAKRCSSCTEAWRVIDQVLAGRGYGISVNGTTVGDNGLTGTRASNPVAQAIGAGPFGAATSLVFHSGATLSITGAAASVVVTSSAGPLMAASETPTGARLVVVGDSSTADDGRCSSCSAKLFDGWDEGTDREFLLNATAWLARDGS